MASGWLRGTVKEVPAGDTIVIIGAGKAVPPPEKRITLSSLIAPKLGKRDGTTRDEAFAWESREFLRKKLIGQAVVFKIDYVVEAIGNREFGSVFLGQENVSLTVVTNGWAKVRASGTQQSPYIEDYKRAEENAQQQGVGLWTKDPVALSQAVRDVNYDDGFSALDFLQTVGKGKPVPAIVEQVINGSLLRVCLLPDFQYVLVNVGGIQAPSMGRRAPQPVPDAEGVVTSASIAAAVASTQPEPYAVQAKMFTESKTLNKEVRVVVEGVDKYNNLFASILYPEADQPANLAEQLLDLGYAKAMDWSLNMLSSGANRLRELERKAKQERKAMWTNYVPQNTGQTKLSDNFTGKVVEIASGDCMVIKDLASNTERRVNLSSIRAPKAPMGKAAERRAAEEGEDPAARKNRALALEAREVLRKRFIGQEVEVHMEYTRKVPLSAADIALGDGASERIMSFGNVILPPAKPTDEPINAAEMIVARGLAEVIRHRSDEERSSVYEKLVELEDASKRSKRGMHSAKDPPPNRINDVSQPGNAARAKQHLPFLQRNGKMQAVVDYVLSGHRLKLLVPKEGVSLAFAPSGIKAPQRAQPASNGRPAIKGEPYADEALAYTRELLMQRDVEVTIETVDRAGTFLGDLTISGPRGPVKFGTTILRAGLAKLHPSFDPDRVPGGRELAAAEEAAREARLKVWENWTPEEAPEDDDAPAANNGTAEAIPEVAVTITEVTDTSEFFVQYVEEPRVQWITDQLANVSMADVKREAPLAVGSLCLGLYSLDNQWYRAFITRVYQTEPKFEVFFTDYGNTERLATGKIAPMDASLAAVESQAWPCELAHVQLPAPDSEYAPEALGYFQQLVGGGRKLMMKINSRERGNPREKHPKKQKGKLHVTLLDPESDLSVNANMLAAGLAKLPKLKKVRDPAAKEAIKQLQEFEDEARKGHRGMFQYGDPGDSDDEPLAPAPPKAWGKK